MAKVLSNLALDMYIAPLYGLTSFLKRIFFFFMLIRYCHMCVHNIQIYRHTQTHIKYMDLLDVAENSHGVGKIFLLLAHNLYSDFES